MTAQQKPFAGMILDESTTFSLDELCGVCRTRREILVEMVEEGVIEPLSQTPAEWQFAATQLPRVRRALHLYHDLELNLAGVALTLELLEELSELRARLRQLETTF